MLIMLCKISGVYYLLILFTSITYPSLNMLSISFLKNSRHFLKHAKYSPHIMVLFDIFGVFRISAVIILNLSISLWLFNIISRKFHRCPTFHEIAEIHKLHGSEVSTAVSTIVSKSHIFDISG